MTDEYRKQAQRDRRINTAIGVCSVVGLLFTVLMMARACV